MSSRSRPARRERQDDPLEAVKPLVVLVLFGTILYGAYTVVQKGPTPGLQPDATATGGLAEAPVFNPPRVDLPAEPGATPAHAETAGGLGGPIPFGGAIPVGGANPVSPPLSSPTLPAAPTPSPSAAIATGAAPAADFAADRPAGFPPAPATPEQPGAAPTVSSAPTYLSAQTAPPPGPDAVPPAPAARPDRYAALPAPGLAPAPPPAVVTATAGPAPAGPAPFAAVWADAHDKLAAGRYAEALQALSAWHDDPSLGLEESQRLDDLLGQLAGTVIYSQRDLMLPPHVVAPGDTLPALAAPLGVSWQLLAKINGIDDPARLVPGEHLKLVRGPFDAVVSVSRRRLTLQLHGNYAGSFPVVVGRQFLARVGGSLPVVEVHRADAATTRAATLQRSVVLGDGLVIEAVDDPGLLADGGPSSSLVVSVRDLNDVIDILGPGSRVLIRQ